MSTQETTSTSAPGISRWSRRRITAVSGVGSMIEFFDFTIYTYLLVYFAPLFFPSDDPTASTVSAVAALGAAYIVRPVGSAIWGWIGDRRGRRTVLTATLVFMGLASLGLGLLPTYDAIGIAAPIILVLLRVVQGFSASGENVTASTYLIESAPPRQRGLYSGIVPAFSILGQALGALTGALLAFGLPAEAMSQYGWRIPFLVAGPLTLIVLFFRRKLEDSPEFQAIEQSDNTVKSPLWETVRAHGWTMLKVIAVTLAVGAPSFTATVYVVSFLITERGFGNTAVYIGVSISMVVAAACAVFAGALADRFNRRAVGLVATAALVVTSVPVLMLVADAESLVLIVVGMSVMLGLYGVMCTVVYALIAEWFPTEVRLTGSAVGYNIGAAISGGVAPVVTLQIAVWTGSAVSPAFWIAAVSVLAFVLILLTRKAGYLSKTQ